MKPEIIALLALGGIATIALVVLVAKKSAPPPANNDADLLQIATLIAEIYAA